MSEKIREAGAAFGAAIADELAALRTSVDATNTKVDEATRRIDETNTLLRAFLDVFHTMESHNWQSAEQRYVKTPGAADKPPFRIIPDAATLSGVRAKKPA